jgi:hypothetical protein
MRIDGEAPGRQFHSRYGMEPRVASGDRHLGSSSVGRRLDDRRNHVTSAASLIAQLWRPAQDDTGRNIATGDKSPQCDEQLAGQCDNHGLAPFAGRDARLIPLCQCAVLLKEQEASSELNHATTHPRVAGLAEALLAPS